MFTFHPEISIGSYESFEGNHVIINNKINE
jgi:hypothetical protein